MASGITPPKRGSRNGIRDSSPCAASVGSPSPTIDRSDMDDGGTDEAAHVKVLFLLWSAINYAVGLCSRPTFSA